VKVSAIIVMISIIAVLGGMEALTLPVKEIVINDNGSIIIVKTREQTVEDALNANNITIRPEDYIYPALDQKLSEGITNEIIIKRAVPVCIYVDGQQRDVLTHETTVRGVLEENNITLNDSDRLEGAGIDDPIFPGMNLRIVRVVETLITESETISYNVERRPNNRLDQGVERTVREGKEGIREYLYRVVYEDGVLVTKELVQESVVSAPINKIIEYGTVAQYTTARGETFRYSKVLNMRATAYTSSYKDTGKTPDHPAFGITYTGIKARRGIIAVDPKVIPLGTRVYVEGVGKTPDYGYALAADIGGAIKGDLIDLYFETQEEADNWGLRKVRVYILSED